jgi:AbrB family looped-hinge helix DNA binding protein
MQMANTMTVKGQVTIPKRVRDALQLSPGDGVEFQVNEQGQVVVSRAAPVAARDPDRFERALGTAQIKWRTDELMALLRPDD